MRENGVHRKPQAELVRVVKWVQYAEGRSSWTPVQAVAEGFRRLDHFCGFPIIHDALEMKRKYFSMNTVIV